MKPQSSNFDNLQTGSQRARAAHIDPTTSIAAKFQLVTGPIAETWLMHNHHNRPIRRSHVDLLVRDLRAGNYLITHQGVAFDESGALIDGQHRLAAIVESGVDAWLLVVQGLPRTQGDAKTMDAVDRHSVRTVADMLQLNHNCEKVEAKIRAAIAVTIVRLIRFGKDVGKLTPAETVAVLQIWNWEIEWLLERLPAVPQLRCIGFLSAVVVARAANAKVAESFFEAVTVGEGLAKNSAAFAARKYMLEKPISGVRLTRSPLASLLLGLCARHAAKQQILTPPERDPEAVAAVQAAQKEKVARLAAVFAGPKALAA